MSEIPLIKKRFTNAFAAKGLSDERGKTMKLSNKILLGLAVIGISAAGAGAVATNAERVSATSYTSPTTLTFPTAAADSTSSFTMTTVLTGTCGLHATTTPVTNGTFITAVTAVDKVYPGKYGWKFSSAKVNGVFTFSLPNTITSVVANFYPYLGTTADNTPVKITSVDDGLTGQVTVTGTATTLCTTSISACSSTSFKIEATGTASSTHRFYLSSLTFTYATIVEVDPASIVVTGATAIAAGETSNLSAKVYGSDGTTLSTDQSIVWTTSDSSIAQVSSTGAVTGLNGGNVTITTTSGGNSSIVATHDITVSAATVSKYDKTLVYTDFGSSYSDGFKTVGGVTYKFAQIIGNTSYKEIILGSSAGSFIANGTQMPAPIKTITLTCYNTPTVVVKAGSAYGAVATIIANVANASVYTFDFTAGTYYFFEIDNGVTTATASFYSIVVQLVDTSVESARTYAASFLSGTATECSALALTSTTWDGLSSQYAALSAEAKLAFTSEGMAVTVTDIQKTISLYKYVVTKYSYTNFMGITISPSAVISPTVETSQSSVALVVICFLGLIAIAGFFLVTKKHA